MSEALAQLQGRVKEDHGICHRAGLIRSLDGVQTGSTILRIFMAYIAVNDALYHKSETYNVKR